jgi:hypothetical protein
MDTCVPIALPSAAIRRGGVWAGADAGARALAIGACVAALATTGAGCGPSSQAAIASNATTTHERCSARP